MDGSRQAGTDPRSDRRFDLVLGGGGALGAFQAGVYEALEEAGRDPDRLVGTSIGALNAALIAGNPPERRLERLRAFWDQVAEPALSPAALSGDARRMAKAVFALHARLLGRPGLYRPHLPRLFLQNPAWGSPSLHHLGPALATLRRLVDFDRIGDGGPGLAVNLTDLETGAPVLVDSASDRLRPEHLVASMGLLPDFRRPRSTAGGSAMAAFPPTCRCMRFLIPRRRPTCCASRSTCWATRDRRCFPSMG